MNKNVMYVLITVVLMLGVGIAVSADSTGIRSWLCDVFLCDAFTNLEGRIEVIDGKLDEVISLVSSSGDPDLMVKMDRLLVPERSMWIEGERVVNPSSNDYLDITIWIRGESMWEMSAFGIGNGGSSPPLPGIVYDPTELMYQSTQKGDLVEDWVTVDSNEISSGEIVCGGLAGTGKPISGSSIGSVVVLRFMITDDQDTEFTFDVSNFVDGFVIFHPFTEVING